MSDADPAPVDAMLREQTWGRHRVWLKRLAASLVVDAARADDVTQQALLAALERPPADATRPRAWLATVARNVARRFAIGEVRRDAREHAAAAHERLPATDEVVARADLQVQVSIAVLGLAEPYRSALLLRFFDDLPPRAIAKRLGIPVATARTRILRGIEQLRERLIAQRGASATLLEPAPGAIVGLVALLDGAARKSVQRALLAKSAASGTAIVGGSAMATLGLLGVIGMSTKLKLAVTAALVACGAFAVVELGDLRGSPPRDAAAGATREPPPLPAPAIADATPLPARAEPTRASETADVTKPAAEATPAPLATQCAIAGIVRTERGDPVAGALVLLEDARSAPRFDTISNLCAGAESFLGGSDATFRGSRTLSASDGGFRFEAVVSGGSVNVAAIDREEGTALATGIQVDGSSGNRELELVLTAGVVLHGTVTGEQGAPIAGARVQVMQFSRTKESTSSSSLLGVTADADGRFRTLPLPFDGFRVTARAEGCFRASLEAFPIAPDERERRMDLQLARAPTWRGAILTSDGERARLADQRRRFEVVASSVDPNEELTTPESLGDLGKVDAAEDRYELTPDEPGRRFLSLFGDGVLLGVVEIAQPDVAPDLIVDLARLPPPKATGTLAIVVVDARTGAPIPSYHFALTGDPLTLDQPNARDESRQVESADGRVAIEALVAGSYDVTVRAPGFAPHFANLRVIGSTATAAAPESAALARLELRPANARVDGRVEDEAGRPITAAAVYLLNVDGTSALPSPENRVASDADGRFRFDGVAEGDYLVVASRDPLQRLAEQNRLGSEGEDPDGFGEVAPASAPAKARAADAIDSSGRDLAVVKLWRGFDVGFDTRCAGKTVMGPFSFRIRDERGAAVHDHHRPSSTTQMSGSGFWFRLAPGDYTIEVFSPQFAPSRTSFRATPEVTVLVELKPR